MEVLIIYNKSDIKSSDIEINEWKNNIILYLIGADREVTVTVNIEDSCFLLCPPFEDLENITIDWYRCSPENGPCDKHRNHIPIVHVKNMTQKNFYYPNLDIYPDGTLVIKKLLPMDDGVKFICSATKDYVGRKTWITILNITKGDVYRSVI